MVQLPQGMQGHARSTPGVSANSTANETVTEYTRLSESIPMDWEPYADK